MNEYNLLFAAVREIVDLSSKGQYQIACTKYYESIHGQPPSTIINHPNQYFQESKGIGKSKEDGGKKSKAAESSQSEN